MNPSSIQQALALAIQHQQAGELRQAEAIYRNILEHDPNHPDAWHLLGILAHAAGHHRAGIDLIRRAIQLNPLVAVFHSNLGKFLKDSGELEAAVASLRRAVELSSGYANAHHNLGLALTAQGKIHESIGSFERVLAIDANHVGAHWDLGLALLRVGRWKEGWEHYEWRWRQQQGLARDFKQPLWKGEDLAGRTILLHAEQGLGDAIQFIRYAPLVAQRGGNVVVECDASLTTLFQTVRGVQRIVRRGESLGPFDVHAPLLSLARIFETTAENVPASVPYVQAEPDRTAQFRCKLVAGNATAKAARVRVGVVWRGSAVPPNPARDLPLAQLAPLARISGVTFYSLQKGPGAAEAARAPLNLIDLTHELHDFADTAALAADLDLIISVDTSVAHLAGAMAKRVWTLLPFVADWRWMLERNDTPWYPTMRLFRQSARGDWSGVIERVAAELKGLVESASA